jgi:anti-sigma B factor antagonist
MDLAKESLLTSQVTDGVVVISFSRGRIRDEREIINTLESLGRYMESKTSLKVVLDLGNVEYLSSAGLGHLVGLLKKARSRQSDLKLCCLRESIGELFEVMMLTQIFAIFDSAHLAIQSFKAEATQGAAAPSPGAPDRPLPRRS